MANYTLIKRIQYFIKNKEYTQISIQNRLTAVFSLCLITSSLISIIINASIGLPLETNIVVFIIATINCLVFYFSIRNQLSDPNRCVYLCALVSFLPMAWIYNGGLIGSIPLFFFIYFIAGILSLTAPYRKYFITYTLGITIAALIIQNHFAHIIIGYSSLGAQLFDMEYAFIQVVIISIVITITFTNINDEILFQMQQQKRDLENSNQKLAEAIQIAQKANIAKTNFITNISHEIRTPLNGIIGISDLLESFPLTNEKRELVHNLTLSSKTLLDLINDLLDISKIEANKLTLKNEIFGIRDAIEETDVMMKTLIKNSDITLETIINERTPTHVLLDRNKYKQILINLLSNAIKFTPKGKITCTIDYDSNTSTLITIVQDTGIGIAAEHLNNLFNPFTQLDTPNHVINNGIGMGLTISKKIIEFMNGNITVSSEEHNGSTFTFTIPIMPINQQTLNLQTDLVNQNNDLLLTKKIYSILVAEDNRINQLVITKMLEKLDHKASFVNNGQEAIDICNEQDFDIILMDVQMPLKNGIDAAKEIVEKCHLNNKPKPKIVICSANTMLIDNKNELQDIIVGYLTKPIKLDDLDKMINSL